MVEKIQKDGRNWQPVGWHMLWFLVHNFTASLPCVGSLWSGKAIAASATLLLMGDVVEGGRTIRSRLCDSSKTSLGSS